MSKGLHVSIDIFGSLSEKISRARLNRVLYYLVIGSKEIENKTVAIRKRDSEEVLIISFEACLELLEQGCKEPLF